ncbi:hypothetical protein [Flavobacterium sp. FlaQc-47]
MIVWESRGQQEFQDIDFYSSEGKDMSGTIALLKLQEQGIRIRK